MNGIPKTGHTVFSRDRHVVKRVSLTPEERERLQKIDKEEVLHPCIEESLAETEEILKECEERKSDETRRKGNATSPLL